MFITIIGKEGKETRIEIPTELQAEWKKKGGYPEVVITPTGVFVLEDWDDERSSAFYGPVTATSFDTENNWKILS